LLKEIICFRLSLVSWHLPVTR